MREIDIGRCDSRPNQRNRIGPRRDDEIGQLITPQQAIRRAKEHRSSMQASRFLWILRRVNAGCLWSS
jgi:hypothetical protein